MIAYHSSNGSSPRYVAHFPYGREPLRCLSFELRTWKPGREETQYRERLDEILARDEYLGELAQCFFRDPEVVYVRLVYVNAVSDANDRRAE